MPLVGSLLDILLVEHEDDEVARVRRALAGTLRPGRVRVASTMREAVAAIDDREPSVAILAQCCTRGPSPDAGRLAAHAPDMPIIVVADVPNGLGHARKLGAQEYMQRSRLSADTIAQSVRYAIEKKRSEAVLTRAACHDPVTGLYNRRHFLGLLEHALTRAQRTSTSVNVLFVDLDDFKQINDSLGHTSGDLMLERVGQRLRGAVRESDVVARTGGDEFAVLIEGVSDAALASISEKIIGSSTRPYDIAGVDVITTASIGIAGFPRTGSDATSILTYADAALSRAKARRGSAFEFASDGMTNKVRDAFDTEMLLRRALDRDEFELHYQPIVARASGSTQAVEALLRWRPSGTNAIVSPADFLPILERTGLLREVGAWVLRTACAQCRKWQQELDSDLRVAVNVSPVQLASNDFAQTVAQVLEETGLAPECLQIEITEQVLLQRTEQNLSILGRVRDMGVNLAIDDFGSGYASLSYLTAFPFDTVKIDRSFVNGVADGTDDAMITAGILDIASKLGRMTIAEGVETEAQMSFLAQHPCDEVQGYLFSRPLTGPAFEAFHRRGLGVAHPA